MMVDVYAVITPARNEAENLPRLAESLARQHVLPSTWVIVDNGSTDGTMEVARTIAVDLPWVVVLECPGTERPERGGPTVRAFHVGLASLDPTPEVVVLADADISLEPDYFERLLDAFETDDLLGVASGSAYEIEEGSWKQRFVTGDNVWGAARAYRWRCLQDVLPLEEKHAYDAIAVELARARGWRTRTLTGLPFYHHRPEGIRDRGRLRRWSEAGRISHYMGYRGPYLVMRSLYHTRRDPAALAMLWGYVAAATRRSPQLPDEHARVRLREGQRLRDVPRRAREARGTRQA